MKKVILIVMYMIMFLGITGCGKKDVLNDTYKKISEYFESKEVDKSYLGSYYLDNENNVVVVTLNDNSIDTQNDFLKNVKVDAKYIKFKEVNLNIDFYVSKLVNYNDIKFNDYFKSDDRTIYLAGYIDEFYVVDNGQVRILKDYISQTNRSFDNNIKLITDKLVRKDILKDGGTAIYKSEEKDITLIVCNTLDNNKDIYIGNYKMEYEEDMCN